MGDLELRDMACAMEIAERFNPRKAPWIAMKIGEHMAEERERTAALLDALELPLLFYSGGPWIGKERERWEEITGKKTCTTRIMCNHIRAVRGEK